MLEFLSGLEKISFDFVYLDQRSSMTAGQPSFQFTQRYVTDVLI